MQIRLPLDAKLSTPAAEPAGATNQVEIHADDKESGMYELDEPVFGAKIKVVGVGGAGGNAVNTMISSELMGVDFIAANTDLQALRVNRAPNKVQLGPNLTKGLGAGSNPETGRQAALEDRDRIAELLAGADLVFVTAGMGGGTGTGAAPVIAQIAREVGALTVGVVTRPFTLEGKQRARQAEEGIRHLRDAVDSLVIIPNDKLLVGAAKNMTLIQSLQFADGILFQGVRGITDIIQLPGLMNVDFADVRTVMYNQGLALMGIGEGKGEDRAAQAAEQAISSPLLDDINIKGARGILVNITAPKSFGLGEYAEALKIIQEEAHEEVMFKSGVVYDESLGDTVRVTVIATGFESVSLAKPLHVRPAQVVNMPPQPAVGRMLPNGGGHGPAGAPAAAPRPTFTAVPNRDLPAHLRADRELQLPEPQTRHDQLGPVQDEYDELDVPAWLRRQRD
jgi:cell division protein FtsZ